MQKSVYGSTQKEVRQKLNATVKALDGGTYSEPSKMTVAQWLDEWTENHLFDVKPRTVKSYTDNCRLHLKPYIGAIKLPVLDESRLSKLFVELYKGTEEKKPLSAKTIKNVHGMLHRALADAVRMKAIKFNPADNMKLPRIEKKEMHPLDEKQVQAFLKAIRGHEL